MIKVETASTLGALQALGFGYHHDHAHAIFLFFGKTHDMPDELTHHCADMELKEYTLIVEEEKND